MEQETVENVGLHTPTVRTIKKIVSQETLQTPAFDIVGSFDKKHVQVLESSIALNTPALLVGHTGLGKTTLIKELAKQHGKTLIRLSVHSGVTADEILGKWLAENGSTIWQDGLLTQAMKAGNWIVFDEINACPPDVLFALHSLLDDDRHITLLEKKGEVIRPHSDFRFFATMNPQDDYAGTKEINMAFMSRFNAVIEINCYEKNIEQKILMSKGISKDDAIMLVSTAQKLRDFKSKDDIMYFCGTRDLISAGLMLKQGLSSPDAVQYAITNKMSADDKAYVKGKIPDAGYKTQAERDLENLEENFKNMQAQHAQAVTELQADIKVKEALIEGLKVQVSQTNANNNVNLDANTMKALKILKVLN